jgi:hypothetical protein
MCQAGFLGSVPSQQQTMVGNTTGKKNLPAWLAVTREITPEASSSFTVFISRTNKMQLHSEQITKLWKLERIREQLYEHGQKPLSNDRAKDLRLNLGSVTIHFFLIIISSRWKANAME